MKKFVDSLSMKNRLVGEKKRRSIQENGTKNGWLRLALLIVFGSLLLFCGKNGASAPVFAQETPIRLAVFDGGHPFDAAAFDTMLADVSRGMTVQRFHFPEDRDLLGPELADKFDVVLFYDMDNTPLSDEQKSRIDAMFHSGIGVFALHHHVCSNQNWPEYWKYVGGIAVFETNKMINGQEQPLSTFIDGQTLDVCVVPETPFSQTMDNFTIDDEAYGQCYVDSKATVLLTSEHPLSTSAVAWLWNENESPVLVCLLGHDAKSYNHPSFRQFLEQGVQFLASPSKNRQKSE